MKPIDPHSRQKTIAYAVAAACMLVPANLIPVIRTQMTGAAQDDTIYSGIVNLGKDGMWGIAAIVFTASMLVPALKLASLTVLLVASHGGPSRRAPALTRLYTIVDFIGRWSMLDVFLVAFLTGLVAFGSLATISPQPGIVAFGTAVVFTVLATESFDPRSLWPPDEADKAE